MKRDDHQRGLYGKYVVQKIKRGDGGLCPWSPDGLHHAAPGLNQACSYCPGPRPDELVDPGPVFVLAYTSDPHARVALKAYAESCHGEYPQLAADLIDELAKHPEADR